MTSSGPDGGTARDALAADFAATAFPHPFRRYQQLALDAFERAHATGDRRLYLTLPPGSGKTLLGLEVARRLGRPTLVLAPTTAIVGQWLSLWGEFTPPVVPAGERSDLASPLTVLTYQALCVLRSRPDATMDPPDPPDPPDAPDPPAVPDPAFALTASRQRRLVARGGDREEVLGLLHPNGRAIVDRLAALGPVTLVLDECHRLLELWGALLAAVVETLGPETFVVALTATPPSDLGPRARRLHDQLFGTAADFEVVAPAVVKDGYLAPYQELALLTTPLPHEERFVTEEGERFATLLREVQGPDLGSLPFVTWLERRVALRTSRDGVEVGWATLERDDPDLARAALRLRWSRGEAPARGARYAEAHRREPDAADWAALLDAWAMEALAPSTDSRDRVAWEHLRRALPSVGYRLTRTGVVRSTSVVDRVLALSGSKAIAAATILSAEHAVLGERLRGLVLCDHESAGRDPGARLSGVLDPDAGSAALVLRTLLDGTAVPGLDPVLVTGRTVACSRATAERLVRFAAGEDSPLAGWDPLTAPSSPRLGGDAGQAPGWEDVVIVDPADARWASRTWVPLLTRFFAAGGSRCLVGTRALLGEGWDSPPVNVVIDLTSATTRAAVHQLRGRGMRLDPADPRKVADLWDVVCIGDGHPQGDADHARFARKHEHDLSITETGEIESGLSHVDAALSPFGPPGVAERAALRARALARPDRREAVRAAWRIGQPYRDLPVGTLRVRTGRPPGLPARGLLRHAAPVGARGRGGLRGAATATVAGTLAALLAGWVTLGPGLGVLAALAVAVMGVTAMLRVVARGIGTLEITDLLGDLGRAVADALVATGLTAADAGAPAVRVVAQPDGYHRCLLADATAADSARFAEALEQLLAPIWDPRWLIPRPVLLARPTVIGAAQLGAARLVGRLRPRPLVWHAIPDDLAARQDRVAAFQVAWRHWVAPDARAIRARDPMGEAVLAARRGDDPFATETLLRTLWT